MFGLLKTQNPHEQNYQEAAEQVYAALLERTRQPVFYTDMEVPDSFGGRFDLLVLHIFVVINRTLEEGGTEVEFFNQALFDTLFADMDQALRTLGIGDMGVPKRMRKMMRGFNGRMHGYSEALTAGDDALADCLRRNVYSTAESVSAPAVKKLLNDVQNNVKTLASQSFEDIASGQITLAEHKK